MPGCDTRRKQESDRIIHRLLGKLLTKHPDLFPTVQAFIREVLRLLVDVAAAHPTFTDDQIADELAKEISNMPVEETLIACGVWHLLAASSNSTRSTSRSNPTYDGLR